MGKVLKPCEDCGSDFYGYPQSKRCDKCSKERNREKVRRWKEKNLIRVKDYQKSYYEHNFNAKKLKQEMEKQEEIRIERKEKADYCKSYDKTQIECIQCYENQTAEYKGCHK